MATYVCGFNVYASHVVEVHLFPMKSENCDLYSEI